MNDAAERVQEAVVAALRGGMGSEVTGVFDGPPAGAVLPYVGVAETLTSDWSAKGLAGREHRVAVIAWDEPGRAARLHRMMAAAEDAIEAMPRVIGSHRVAGLQFLRARLIRESKGPWAGLVEYRVRTVSG